MKSLNIIKSTLGFVIGTFATYIQFLNLFFINMNRSSLDDTKYTLEDVGQILTIVVCLWFTVIHFMKLLGYLRTSAMNG